MTAPGTPARGLSAAELAAAVAELRLHEGATVTDVATMRTAGGDDDLLLVLRGASGAKMLVHCALGGARARVTATARHFAKASFGTSPIAAALQQHLRGATLSHVAQAGSERRCTFHFATANGDRRLIVELFGARGLWALLDADGVVRAMSRDVATAVRTLRPGDVYVAPPPGPARDDAAAPRFPPPVLPAIDAWFTAHDLRAELALEHERCERAARRALQNARDRTAGIGAQLAETDRSARLREQADMMLAFAHTVARGASVMTYPDPGTGEPRSLELDPSRPVTAQARALYEKARRLDDGRAIAEQRLAEARRATTALESALADLLAIDPAAADAATRVATAARQLQVLGALPRPRTEPSPPRERRVERGENFRRFVSAEGYAVLVGRDNEQNDRLTMRVANGNDLWLHVGGGRPGSHVVVRLPKAKTASLETLLDAAALAVHFSKARGEPRIEVIYTLRKHVRKPKGLPPGAVVPAQTKTIVSLLDEARLRRLLDSADAS